MPAQQQANNQANNFVRPNDFSPSKGLNFLNKGYLGPNDGSLAGRFQRAHDKNYQVEMSKKGEVQNTENPSKRLWKVQVEASKYCEPVQKSFYEAHELITELDWNGVKDFNRKLFELYRIAKKNPQEPSDRQDYAKARHLFKQSASKIFGLDLLNNSKSVVSRLLTQIEKIRRAQPRTSRNQWGFAPSFLPASTPQKEESAESMEISNRINVPDFA